MEDGGVGGGGGERGRRGGGLDVQTVVAIGRLHFCTVFHVERIVVTG